MPLFRVILTGKVISYIICIIQGYVQGQMSISIKGIILVIKGHLQRQKVKYMTVF